MSFHHAPVSKALMLGLGVASLAASIFDVRHHLHLQLVPHISRDHQYWRILAHQFASAGSTDLLLFEIILFAASVPVERRFGSVKYASTLVILTMLSTLFIFVALILFHGVGLNRISSGPIAIIFAILSQYHRLVPSAYSFRLFGLSLSSKFHVYLMALQLLLTGQLGGIISAFVGLIVGQLYVFDFWGIKSYRLSPKTQTIGRSLLLPLIGATRPPRRTNRAIPEEEDDDSGPPYPPPRETPGRSANEVASSTSSAAQERGQTQEPVRSHVREWVNQLAGRETVLIRQPSQAEVAEVARMFPNLTTQAITLALQRSPSTQAAVEILLERNRSTT